MQTVIHLAETRGRADRGWLQSRHTFSFADYHDPERVHFGALRVLNDDVIAPGTGFGMHPHHEMEIVTVPLAGALRHRDSMGNEGVIRAGEVQAMSAGTGITHSEYNASAIEPVSLLQIWVLPKYRGIAPRYSQNRFDVAQRHNRPQFVVAPDAAAGALAINQDAWFALADLDAGKELPYPLHSAGHGVYIFVIDGNAEVAGAALDPRDAIGISGMDPFTVRAARGARLLFIEVPIGQD